MNPIQSKHIRANRRVLIGWQPKSRLMLMLVSNSAVKRVGWVIVGGGGWVEGGGGARSKNRRPVTQGQTGNRVVTWC